jgi:hypothetical protein
MRGFFGDPSLPRGLDAFFPETTFPTAPKERQKPARQPSSADAASAHATELRDTLPEALLGEAFRMVMDFVLPPLPLSEQVTYLWLFRYAYGFNRNHCRVSRLALMRVTGLSKRGLDLALAELEKHNWIATVEVSYRQGTLYRVYLPHEQLEELSSSLPNSTLLDSQLPSSQPLKERESIINTKLSLSKESSTLPSSRLPSRQLQSKISPNGQFSDPRLEQLLDKFYAGLNQRRISSLKRERGLTALAGLLQDGYTIDEIAYAIDWTIASIPGLHSINILPEIMGQALAARERLLAEAGTQPSQRAVEESSARAQAEAERARIEDVKASLPVDVLVELQEEARKLVLQEHPNLKLGQEVLIRIKVGELISARYLSIKN